jgi:hypothetical protein
VPSLRELQAGLMDALFERRDGIASQLKADALDPLQRIAVYRNNLQQSLGSALAAVYPTVQELVGDDFFRAIASRYIRLHPSRSGNLQEFGGLLPDYIAGLEATAGLPYLADVARLDWAWHAVFHCAPAPACEAAAALAALAGAPAARRAAARLRWQPAARLLASEHPVFSIWRWHQSPASERGELNPSAGAECLLVYSLSGDVRVKPLDAAEHALLAALRNGASLAGGAAAALALDPLFDLASTLTRHLASGVLGAPTWPATTS